MSQPQRPLPLPTDITRPYWDAAAAQRLVIQECQTCKARQFYPRGFCTACLSDSLEWIECSGRGTIYSYTVNHRAPNAFMKQKLPYVVAAIDLKEGVRLITNIVDSALDKLAIGAPVTVVFEEASDEITLPQFRLVP